MLAAALVLAACGSSASSSSSAGGGSAKLSLVAYSTPKEAYAAIIPAFQKTRAAKGVTFNQSYGASGDQSRAVATGLPADVVALSLAPDVDKLVKAGQVDAAWNQDADNGFVTELRRRARRPQGQPEAHQGWDDLIKKGVEVITPNPFTSGGARWNIMAAYGAQIKQGKSPAAGARLPASSCSRTSRCRTSAPATHCSTFAGGKGDVLISYENEAITAQQKGQTSTT